jgi:hypothetical protein
MIIVRIASIDGPRDGQCRLALVGEHGEAGRADVPARVLGSYVKLRGWLYMHERMVLSCSLRRGWLRYIAAVARSSASS